MGQLFSAGLDGCTLLPGHSLCASVDLSHRRRGVGVAVINQRLYSRLVGVGVGCGLAVAMAAARSVGRAVGVGAVVPIGIMSRWPTTIP